jgi:hypothetical protein
MNLKNIKYNFQKIKFPDKDPLLKFALLYSYKILKASLKYLASRAGLILSFLFLHYA